VLEETRLAHPGSPGGIDGSPSHTHFNFHVSFPFPSCSLVPSSRSGLLSCLSLLVSRFRAARLAAQSAGCLFLLQLVTNCTFPLRLDHPIYISAPWSPLRPASPCGLLSAGTPSLVSPLASALPGHRDTDGRVSSDVYSAVCRYNLCPWPLSLEHCLQQVP
jgi:hypothetical protein